MPKTAAHSIAINESAKITPQSSFFTPLKAYYQLTKPGITGMVVMTATAGYFLGIPNTIEHFSDISMFLRFFLTISGSTLICAGSCVFNNVLEREYDRLMKRTAKRALPNGEISIAAALIFASLLSILGAIFLSFINIPTLLLAIAALVSYVVMYTPMKRRSELALLVGAIPGALPPLGGWTAATGHISLPGMFLFAILFFWQLPHFLSLSWMYKSDYTRGGYKMLAVFDGTGEKVAFQSLVYTILLVFSAAALFVVGTVGLIFAVGSLVLGCTLIISCRKFLMNASNTSARNVLLTSYVYLMGVMLLMLIDKT